MCSSSVNHVGDGNADHSGVVLTYNLSLTCSSGECLIVDTISMDLTPLDFLLEGNVPYSLYQHAVKVINGIGSYVAVAVIGTASGEEAHTVVYQMNTDLPEVTAEPMSLAPLPALTRRALHESRCHASSLTSPFTIISLMANLEVISTDLTNGDVTVLGSLNCKRNFPNSLTPPGIFCAVTW